MSKAQELISRIDRVKQSGNGRWIACCPSHDDKSPSLSIKELDDGRVLIHCFGGCTPFEVVESVGLNIVDLMPDDGINRSPIYKREVQKTVDEWVLDIARLDRKAGKRLSEADKKRELEAFKRVRMAR